MVLVEETPASFVALYGVLVAPRMASVAVPASSAEKDGQFCPVSF